MSLDSLVDPGMVPSPHVHQVVGGNAFNASMPVDDISKLATCTTCTFAQDLSNYWTAAVYFKARNGSYKRVPQMANQVGLRVQSVVFRVTNRYRLSALPTVE